MTTDIIPFPKGKELEEAKVKAVRKPEPKPVRNFSKKQFKSEINGFHHSIMRIGGYKFYTPQKEETETKEPQ